MYEGISTEDLNTLFFETIIRYKKNPVFVTNVKAGGILCLKSLNDMTKSLGDKLLKDDDFDFTPVPLGFCNHNRDAVYIQRIPKRQYKQGLNKNNVLVQGITNDVEETTISQVKTLKIRSVAHCIEGNYPAIDNALRSLIEEDYRSVAISRKFAIDADFYVYYKQERVGLINSDTKRIVFSRSKSFLERIYYGECIKSC